MFGVLENNKIDYRNCTYYGGTIINNQNINTNCIKSGFGMVIFDDSEILLGNWKNDELDGDYVYIGDRVRAFGTMRDGYLEGFNYICTMPSSVSRKDVQENQTVCIYGFFKADKIYGKAVKVQEGQVQLISFINGKYQECIKKAVIRRKQVDQFLSEAFPNHVNFGIIENLNRIVDEECQKSIHGKFKFCLKKLQNQQYFYGFEESYRQNQYGFILNYGDIVSIGEHKNGRLQGLGRSYDKLNEVKDGVFSNGQLSGIGATYNPNSNKHIFGNFQSSKVQIIQQGFSWPQDIIIDLRQQFHLRSPFFISDYVDQEKGASFLQILISHQRSQQKNEFHRRNTQFISSRSPLKMTPGKNPQQDTYRSVRFKKDQTGMSTTNIPQNRGGRSQTFSGYPREYQRRSWKYEK